MKNILIKIIELYQRTPFGGHFSCKFLPTCSEYTKECIRRYGSFKGVYLGFKRIIRCHPFSKGGIDLVPIKEEE